MWVQKWCFLPGVSAAKSQKIDKTINQSGDVMDGARPCNIQQQYYFLPASSNNHFWYCDSDILLILYFLLSITLVWLLLIKRAASFLVIVMSRDCWIVTPPSLDTGNCVLQSKLYITMNGKLRQSDNSFCFTEFYNCEYLCLWKYLCVSWILFSAANRLIGEVVQSRRRPLLGPSPGWKRLLALSHLRHY